MHETIDFTDDVIMTTTDITELTRSKESLMRKIVSSENKGKVVSTLLGHHDQMGYVLWVTIHPILPSDWPAWFY